MEYDDLLNMGTELGYQLMFSGAEIYRVEESVYRLLTAYGLQPQVFAIPNCLIVSLNTPQGHPITQMRRIPSHGTDIELLERCNDLCRRLCREVPPVKQAKELVDGLRSMLGLAAKVTLVAPKSIVRSEGKAVRVIDKRKI